jgi:hypothetical protein
VTGGEDFIQAGGGPVRVAVIERVEGEIGTLEESSPICSVDVLKSFPARVAVLRDA